MTQDFFICHRSLDAVRLAVDFHGRSENREQPLLLVLPGADPSAALSLGLDPSQNDMLNYLSGEQAPSIEGLENVKLLSDWSLQSGCQEILENLLRDSASNPGVRLLPLLLLERLEQDLPVLNEESRLTFFWSTSDMLSNSHLELFEYAAERLEVENPKLGGFYLYQDDTTPADDRTDAIIEIFQPHFKLESWTLPKGLPWQVPASL